MTNSAKHQFIVSNAARIAGMASRRGATVTAEKFNISPYGVYVAKAVVGEYVPKATLAWIKEDNPSMRTRKAKR